MLAAALVAGGGCSSVGSGDRDESIQITGSDTMVNLTLAWTEAYNLEHPTRIIIKGGGSGVGIANLCSGKIDLATASRPMKPKEIETAEANTGKTPKEFIVGRDALAIYVNLENPIESISIEQLAEIYGADGKIGPLEGSGRRQSGLPRRRDHSRQPPEQLGHVRLFQGVDPGQDPRLQRRLHGPKRLERRRGLDLEHALRDRL